ncbi:MAG TPA: class I SAM-dependent methyltransferase [Steroidobacteraceae bacterium]|nr:class I SAM-dependent methyltransferase [Steroidobacteraceae bacterium]
MNALYDAIGLNYAKHRRPDPRIAALIDTALTGAQHIINVGAGTGSYEVPGRHMAAIDPSGKMIAQRPASLARAIQASAEAIPFPDASFDAATAFLTTHHWSNLDAGLKEMARYWRRPAMYLDANARGAISSFSQTGDISRQLERLRRDLEDGAWLRRHGQLLSRSELDLGYRLVIANAAPG